MYKAIDPALRVRGCFQMGSCIVGDVGIVADVEAFAFRKERKEKENNVGLLGLLLR